MPAAPQVSSSIEQILGYTHLELLNKNPFALIHPDDMEYVKSAFIESLLKPNNPVKAEFRFLKADGEYIRVENIGINFLNEPVKNSIFIDGGREDELGLKLKEPKCEKEIALQETHNRVKNTLQLILSLLKLQADYTNDTLIKNCVMIDHSRIKAISLVCQLLHRSADAKHVNMEEYLYDLATNLFAAYDEYRKNVTIKISAFDINFNVDTAVPFGLIINELVTNSLKRGASDNRPRSIEINLVKYIDDTFMLEYSDSGTGLPTQITRDYFSSFGLHLINILVKQLDGRMDVSTSGGTNYKIGFRGINYQAKINH